MGGSGKFSKSETHMELIFRIMAKDIVKDRIRNNPEFYVENEEELNKDTYTFIIFSRELEYLENEKTDKPLPYSELLESFWGKIERYYNMFIDWYENREWYHLIGVLLAKEENQTESYFEELCDLYRTHTKSEFVCKLKERIINEIDFEDKDKTDFSFTHEVVEEYLKSLSYSDKKIDKDKIRNILLLFNVISMQNNTDSDPRFPFDSYQKQKWDIEHIHSVTTERAQNKKEREEWLDSAWPYIESVASDPKVFEMYTKAKDVRDNKFYDDEHATEYDEMYNSVIAFFSGETGIDNKPINEISTEKADNKSGISYSTRIQADAYLGFIIQNNSLISTPDVFKEKLIDWMRVVMTLSRETNYNGGDDYVRAISKGVRKMLPESGDILTYLDKLTDRSGHGFDGDCFDEECLKAKLILRSPEWEKLVIAAEDNKYFNGQIGFLFEISGIDKQFKNACVDKWDAATDQEYRSLFEKYFNIFSSIFGEFTIAGNDLTSSGGLCVEKSLP